MAKQDIKAGITDYTTVVFIPDPASTDGSGKTGLVAANFTVSGIRVEVDNDVTIIDYTSSLNNLAALTTAHTDWGLLEVSSTLAPGLYRLDIADAIFAAGAWSAVVYVMVTTSAAAASPMEFIFVGYDPLDGVRMGLTALPNAAADAAGGLVISDAGGLDADAQRADVAAILVDTGTTLEARIPAALVGGRMDASVGAMAASVMTAAAAAADLTTELQAGVATEALLTTVAGYLDTEIAAIKAKTDNLPADPADASDIAASFTTVNSKLDTIDDFLDTEVAAIKARTDNLPADPADASDIATSFTTVNSKLDTIDDFLDTEVAAIKAKTDNLPASPAADGASMALTSAAVDAILDDVVEGSTTLRQMLRGFAAVLMGKASGLATSTAVYRDIGDTKDRVTATVDADGNRTAVTKDLT